MFKIGELLKATHGRLISSREDLKIRSICIDSRIIKPQEAFLAIKGNNFDGHNFIKEAIKKGAGCVIQDAQSYKITKSKGVAFIKVQDTIRALGDIARSHRNKFDIPIIAVTGSNGKTTAKEMIAWLLSKKLKVLKNEGTKNNQIGLPLALINLNKNFDLAVLEIGTNHFGEVDYLAKICLPNIGVITNIGPAHLEYLKNLKGVFREKYALIKNLKKPYIGILNADDNLLRKETLKKDRKPFILSFGIKKSADFRASDIKSHGKKWEFLVKGFKFTLNTPGYYNIYNALAAIAVARIFGMDYPDIINGLADFGFPQGRLNFVTINETKFIDDTYNSNPFSLKQALETLANLKTKGRKIFVMGDMLELGSRSRSFHLQAGQKVKEICDIFMTVGELSKFAAEAAGRSGFNSNNIFTCGSTKAARDILFNKISLETNDIVLVKGSRAMQMEEIFKK